jgi:CubicO group peptidase (beta-lactamase class C family)
VTERCKKSCRTNATAENRYHLRNLRGAWVLSSIVSNNSLVGEWPGTPSVVLFRLNDGVESRVVEAGDLEAVRPWASVSKMAVSLAFAVEFDWELHAPTEGLGPRGATLANLLSHSSGLGLEDGDSVVDIGTKRVYSNYGIDYAVNAIIGDNTAANWLDVRVFQPFGMSTSKLAGRPSSGVEGSTSDLARLAVGWLRPDGISRETRTHMITPYLSNLDGIVPGFGRFSPCPWGLGPEIRGEKQHWMGDWPPSSFGHFGQSGSLMLLNVEERIGLVATSTVPFGAWAATLWPQWTSAMRQLALGS